MEIRDFRLKTTDWLDCPKTGKVMHILNDGDGHDHARFVGGCVRNALLGKAVGDVDIATTRLPADVMRLFRAQNIKVIPTGIDHGTVTVIVDKTPFEITTLRLDKQTDGRHAEVEFTNDWKEDASRRDFTMNALYLDQKGSVLCDYFGGYKDLCESHVRFIGVADNRIEEDYLRILRFFRFSALYGGGFFDDKALKACFENRAGLKTLSKERIGDEFFKILKAPHGFKTLQLMFEYEIMQNIVPLKYLPHWLKAFFAFEDSHGFEPCEAIRLSLLSRGQTDAQTLFKSLRISKKQKERIQACHSVMDFYEGNKDTPFFYGFYFFMPRIALAGLVALSFMDDGYEINRDNVLDYYRNWIDQDSTPEFPVHAKMLLDIGYEKNAALGRILKHLEKEWALSGGTLSKDDLIKQAQRLKDI